MILARQEIRLIKTTILCLWLKANYAQKEIISSTTDNSQILQQGGYGTSHVVRGHLILEHYESIVFTAYRPHHLCDALTEDVGGSGIAVKDGHAAIWFDVGNFRKPWQHGETVMLIVEAVKQGIGYFAVSRIEMNAHVDIQEIGTMQLEPIPIPVIVDGNACWQTVDNEHVIGYSVYATGQRRNDAILLHGSFVTTEDIVIRAVFSGGYETVYASFMQAGAQDESLSRNHALIISPNPFEQTLDIRLSALAGTGVSVRIFDISGRVVKTLMNNQCLKTKAQSLMWDGTDGSGRDVSAGVYFVHFLTGYYQEIKKVILLR